MGKADIGASPSGRKLPRPDMSDQTQRFRRGSGGGMYTYGDQVQHGKPTLVVARDYQRSRRKAGDRPTWVADGPVVATTSGNAGRAKGPYFKASARSKSGTYLSKEIGHRSNNSTHGSEIAGGATRQSEASTELSLLCLVRQDFPSGCPGTRLRPLPRQRRHRRRGWSNVRDDQVTRR